MKSHDITCSHIVVSDKKVHMLDLAAKLDSTAEYLCKLDWGDIEFPPPFGRDALPEVMKTISAIFIILLYQFSSIFNSILSFLFSLCQEAYVAELDAKSGASLKLTILNKKGRIWTMVAGGGASVIYRYDSYGFCQ